MIPKKTISVERYLAALSTITPSPDFAATISAATRVVQPKAIATRIPVSISGRAPFITTCHTTCRGLAPIEYAACICSIETDRTPARAFKARGAKHARKIKMIFERSPIPNHMIVSGKYARGGIGR